MLHLLGGETELNKNNANRHEKKIKQVCKIALVIKQRTFCNRVCLADFLVHKLQIFLLIRKFARTQCTHGVVHSSHHYNKIQNKGKLSLQ